MSRRQREILNFILEDVYELLIAFWFFANAMVENTQLETISLVNEALYHAGRVVFILILGITVGRAVRDGSARTVRFYAVLLVGILSALGGAEKWMLELAVLVVGLRGTDRDRILKKNYVMLLAATIIIITLGILGVISGQTVTRENGAVRYSLGFYHPNVLGMRIFQIAAMHLYFRSKERIRPADAVVILLSGVFILRIADSKTATILLLLTGSAALIFAVLESRRAGNAVLAGGVMGGVFKALPFCSALIPVFAVFGFLMLARLPQAADDSSTVWSRVSQSRLYFNYYGLSWHGRALMDKYSAGAPKGMYTLDNGYMYLLLGFGVLAFVLLMAGEICLAFRTYRRGEWVLLIILFLYLLFGMMETSFIRPYCNFFLLLLAEVLWEEIPIKEKKKPGGKS